jgi:RNA polymerase II-associated factor 1
LNNIFRTVFFTSDPQVTPFHFVRDYETVKVEQEVPNEFLLVLDHGTDDGDGETPRRAKGAYYKNIERKMLLKKKRVNVSAPYFTCWRVS